MDLKEQMEEKEKNGWIKVWMAIEVMAVRQDIAGQSLKDHVDKLSSIPTIFVYKKDFSDTRKVEKPPQGVAEAYSQVVELEMFVKDVFSLINTVIVYGPSAVEILSPATKEIGIEELQNTVNVIAGLIHQFAAAGLGGFLISGRKE